MTVDRVGVALREAALFLAVLFVVFSVGGQHLQAAIRAVEVPRAAVGEMLVERVKLILFDDPHVGQAAVQAVAQGEVDQPQRPAEGQRRFGTLSGEHVQAAPRAAGKD